MKAILYAAKSTKDERGSIPTQLTDGRELAEREGWEIVGSYADEAASAYSGDRGPELAQARAEAEDLAREEGESVLVVQHSDRLARGDGIQAAHLVEYALWAIKSGVKIHSIQDPGTFADLLYAVVTGQRNHEDSHRKSLATKAGIARRAGRGLHTGARPYGYRFGDSGLVAIPAEVEVVRRIFRLAAGGTSQQAIVRELEGVPTIRGGRWHQGTIGRILVNPVYRGLVVHDGEEFPGLHEPIIDEETWEKVQETREVRRRTPGQGRGRPPVARHLFRKGMLRCGECGESMIPRSGRDRTRDANYEVYRCYGRHRDPASCSMPPVRRDQIDGAVFSYFEQVGLDLEATREQLATARDRKLSELQVLVEQAESERQRAEERLVRIRRDYTEGQITAADWGEFRSELESEQLASAAALERLAVQRQEVLDWGDLSDVESETVQYLAGIRMAIAGEITQAEGVDGVRAALGRLFEHFTLRRRPERVHAELAWVGGDADLVLEPQVRQHWVERYSESTRPVLRRQALATTNTPRRSPERVSYEPIAVAGAVR
jgi:DNA invertase Pin-like site-specific DNA recombinase